MRKRPLSVTAIGYLYIAMVRLHGPFPYDVLWASLVELIALISGIYILRLSRTGPLISNCVSDTAIPRRDLMG